MKKFLILLIAVVMVISLTACGNMSVTGIGSFTFKHVHVTTYQKAQCFTVTKWVDGSTGIEVHTEEAGAMFLSEGTYILFEDEKDCTFCH